METKAFGTVLILDGVIQCTDRDEFSYQARTVAGTVAGTGLSLCCVADA